MLIGTGSEGRISSFLLHEISITGRIKSAQAAERNIGLFITDSIRLLFKFNKPEKYQVLTVNRLKNHAMELFLHFSLFVEVDPVKQGNNCCGK
jgi:hypothetical protein